MDKKAAGLLGAVAGLATMGSAQAATHPAPNVAEVLKVSSYADLLAPIPDAVALLKADDAARADALDGVQLAQNYYGDYYQAPYPYPYGSPYYRYPSYYHHHHHHHHHHRYHHHHHHHHHHGYFDGR